MMAVTFAEYWTPERRKPLLIRALKEAIYETYGGGRRSTDKHVPQNRSAVLQKRLPK